MSLASATKAFTTLGTAASASGLLPWIGCALVTGAVALFGAGVAVGHRWAASACAAQKVQVALDAANAARATSDRIWNIGLSLGVDLAVTRTRQKTIIEEVERHVDAHPDLAGCVVPADVQQLRDQQVADSERVAAGHPVQ